MTQAFNLSQLANKVNTSGQLDASTGLYNQTPVANGGTGKSSVTSGALLVGAGTSAMTEITGTTANTTVVSSPTGWTSAPIASVAGGDYIMRTYTTPQSWTKPATIKAIKVTVVGAGGNGGNVSPAAASQGGGGGGGGGAAIRYFDAPAIPGPVNVTAGPGTNSFGPWDPASPAPTVTMSATAGSAGTTGSPSGLSVAGGAGGVGANGTIDIKGQDGGNNGPGQLGSTGFGGNSILGGGGRSGVAAPGQIGNGVPGGNFGGGGGGVAKVTPIAGVGTISTGAPGIVIIEEFY